MCSGCATSVAMSFHFFFFLVRQFENGFCKFQNYSNSCIINPNPIINLYNKSQPTSYLSTSTIKPNPRPFRLKGKTKKLETVEGGTLKGFAWEKREFEKYNVERWRVLREKTKSLKNITSYWHAAQNKESKIVKARII